MSIRQTQKRAAKKRLSQHYTKLIAAATVVAVVVAVIIAAARKDNNDYNNPNPVLSTKTTAVVTKQIHIFTLLSSDSTKYAEREIFVQVLKQKKDLQMQILLIFLIYTSCAHICTIAAHMFKSCVANGVSRTWRMNNLAVACINSDVRDAAAFREEYQISRRQL